MRPAARPRTTGPQWLSRRYATRKLYSTVQRGLVSLPAIGRPLLAMAPASHPCVLDDPTPSGSPERRLSVSRRTCEAVVVVTAHGDLDEEFALTLEHKLQRILAAGNLRRLVIDVSRSSDLSHAGVSALLRARQTAGATRIQLRVVIGDGAAREILDRRGVSALLPVAPDVDSACTDLFGHDTWRSA